jgi:hypothetical protein
LKLVALIVVVRERDKECGFDITDNYEKGARECVAARRQWMDNEDIWKRTRGTYTTAGSLPRPSPTIMVSIG